MARSVCTPGNLSLLKDMADREVGVLWGVCMCVCMCVRCLTLSFGAWE